MSKLKVLSSALAELATLDSVLSASKTEQINANNTLSFSFILNAGNTDLINDTNVIGLDGDYYDIAKYKKAQSENGDLTCNVECEHISYRLNDSAYNMEYFTETGTPAYIFGKILDGTPFSVGTIEFTASMTYSIQQAMSRRGLLVQFAELLGGELLFSGFTISILAQRGSATAKDLMAGRNIEIMSKTVDKTTLDDSGNSTVSYECSLIQPMALSLGDVVTMAYSTLGINVTLRIVKITTYPYDSSEINFSVSNVVPTVEDAAYKIATETVSKDALYNGCRIGPEYGFEAVRNDKKARAYFKSDGMKFQSGDGTGSTWTDRLYYDYDSETGESILVFNGKLSASVITALSAVISPNLYAEKATISELTVDQLDTSTKVQNYLSESTADVNYIKIVGQTMQFITASTDGTSKVQAVNRDSQPLYWADETHTSASADVTDYPVMVYVYTEAVKLQISFVLNGTVYEPVIELGQGTSLEQPTWGKGYISKSTDGMQVKYITETGGETPIDLTDFVDAKMRRVDTVKIDKTGGTIDVLMEGETTPQTLTYTEAATSMTITWPDSHTATISIS